MEEQQHFGKNKGEKARFSNFIWRHKKQKQKISEDKSTERKTSDGIDVFLPLSKTKTPDIIY